MVFWGCCFRGLLMLGSRGLRFDGLFACLLCGRRLLLGGGRLPIRLMWISDEALVEEGSAE